MTAAVSRAPTTFESDPLEMHIAVPAERCYQLFCDARRIPHWMAVVRSVGVRSHNRLGWPGEVSLLLSLQRATVGCSVRFSYRAADLRVSWSTPRDSGIQLTGWAAFVPEGRLGARLCYDAFVSLGGALVGWGNQDYDDDPRGAAAAGFASYVSSARACTR